MCCDPDLESKDFLGPTSEMTISNKQLPHAGRRACKAHLICI